MMVVWLFFKLHTAYRNVEQNKSRKQLNMVYFYIIYYIITSKRASGDNIIMCSLYKKKNVLYSIFQMQCSVKLKRESCR